MEQNRECAAKRNSKEFKCDIFALSAAGDLRWELTKKGEHGKKYAASLQSQPKPGLNERLLYRFSSTCTKHSAGVQLTLAREQDLNQGYQKWKPIRIYLASRCWRERVSTTTERKGKIKKIGRRKSRTEPESNGRLLNSTCKTGCSGKPSISLTSVAVEISQRYSGRDGQALEGQFYSQAVWKRRGAYDLGAQCSERLMQVRRSVDMAPGKRLEVGGTRAGHGGQSWRSDFGIQNRPSRSSGRERQRRWARWRLGARSGYRPALPPYDNCQHVTLISASDFLRPLLLPTASSFFPSSLAPRGVACPVDTTDVLDLSRSATGG
ncbi:hypothetical protein DFH06DRAFT_1411842 [Mycena polygramma]|nr:hypothetical protein DFH06DRAFT_1411842 [Mycena polygramma]